MTTHTTQTTELPKHIDVIARSLVNNLFQDVDNTGEIYTELANAICDIHARKFAQTLETEIRKAVENEELIQKQFRHLTKSLETVELGIAVDALRAYQRDLLSSIFHKENT